MVEEVRHDYEVSSEGAVRHWIVPYARMTDATPTPTQPAELTCLTGGLEVTGTILTIDAGNSEAVVDFTCGMVYLHEVRNVLTYNPGVAELTFGAINVGDTVYYDHSASMPAGVKLSTSPLNTDATTNPVFGRVVPANPADTLPKAQALSGETVECAIMQVGAGGS